MKSKAIILMLALFALVSAFASLAGSAQATQLTASQYPALVTGQQATTLTVTTTGGRTSTCATVKGTVTITEATEEGSLKSPEIGTCHAVLLGSTFDVTYQFGPSCLLKFHTNGTGHFICSGSEDLTVTIYNGANVAHTEANVLCQSTTKPQTAANAFSLTNEAGGTVLATVELKVAIERTKGSQLVCGAQEQFALMTGTVTMTATNTSGEPISIDVK